MHGAARFRREHAPVDKGQGGDELAGEEFRAPAIIGKRRHRRDRFLIAGDGAETRLHPPDGDERAGGHTVAFLEAGEKLGIGGLEPPALGDDGRGASLLHEGIERELEGMLAAVGADRALRVGRGGKCGETLGADALGPGLIGEGALPGLELRAIAAARGSRRRASQKSHRGTRQQYGKAPSPDRHARPHHDSNTGRLPAKPGPVTPRDHSPRR